MVEIVACSGIAGILREIVFADQTFIVGLGLWDAVHMLLEPEIFSPREVMGDTDVGDRIVDHIDDFAVRHEVEIPV